MRLPAILVLPPLLLALAACGGEDAKEREVMKPEETVFRDLVTAPDKVEDSVNAAMDAHREALDRQIRESEGDSSGE
jgi:hypothetical protein